MVSNLRYRHTRRNLLLLALETLVVISVGLEECLDL
jgi:hypothetical protein